MYVHKYYVKAVKIKEMGMALDTCSYTVKSTILESVIIKSANAIAQTQ